MSKDGGNFVIKKLFYIFVSKQTKFKQTTFFYLKKNDFILINKQKIDSSFFLFLFIKSLNY